MPNNSSSPSLTGSEDDGYVALLAAVLGDELTELARLRDLTAEARDAAAADRDRDREATHLDEDLDRDDGSTGAVAQHVRDLQALAAADRARAAADRAAAAADRAAAAADRERLSVQLRRAQCDQLTGVFGRQLGVVALRRELDRARRGNGRLVLVFVDVDALRSVNEREGHAAGDLLLRDVTAAIAAQVRSYDPIVRFGGGEFVCALGDADPVEARGRFDRITADLERSHPVGSISVGMAPLRRHDTLSTLIASADADRCAARRRPLRSAPPLSDDSHAGD